MTTPAPDAALRGVLLQLAEQGDELRALRDQVLDLAGIVTDLREQIEGDPGSDAIPYRPIPAPRWWLLAGDEHQAAADRLALWVKAVYQPGYGHLAARLPSCWREHDLCLYMLDWLSELHSVLYLQPRRTAGLLSSQAEWQSRLLPAAADAMAEECARCEHRSRP